MDTLSLGFDSPRRRMRDTRLYDALMRGLGSAWFLLLAMTMSKELLVLYRTLPWSQILSRGCLSVFYLLVWLLVLSRPRARFESAGLWPRLAGLVGSYLPWSITFFGHIDNAASNLLSSVCVIVGTVLMIITVLHLGRAFSLVPQVRAVVRSGPYRLVRHPLYLAEEIAILGVVLQALSPITVAIAVAHLAVQVCRIQYEETLLRSILPAYRAYGLDARWRLVPFIW